MSLFVNVFLEFQMLNPGSKGGDTGADIYRSEPNFRCGATGFEPGFKDRT